MKIPIKIGGTPQEQTENEEDRARALMEDNVERHTGLLDRLSRIFLYVLVFLLPIFFLPWTINVLDFNKKNILGLFVFVAFLAWLVRVLISSRLEIVWTKLYFPIGGFLTVLGLSTLLSFWPEGSLWGWPLSVSSAFLTVLSLVIFYFLAVNTIRRIEELAGLLLVFSFSVFIAALLGLLSLFGKSVFPWDFARTTSFNTIGTINSWGVFLAAVFPLLFILALSFKGFLKFILSLFAATSFFALILVNFKIAWVVLIAGVSIIYLFGILNIKTTKKAVLVSLPISILVVALFFLFFRVSLPILPSTPIEISLSYTGELNIIKEAMPKLGFKNILFGTGPGTFIYNFSLFKSSTINQTVFWNTRFGSGASELLDKLVTLGFLGLAAFISIVIFFLRAGFVYLREKVGATEERFGWMLALGTFSSFFATITAVILYPTNLSLNFLFWILLAAISVFGAKEIKKWKLEPSSYPMIAMSSFLILVIIFGVGLSLAGAQKYVAQLSYVKGLTNMQKGNVKEAIIDLGNAANFSPATDVYWRDLSQLYLVYLNSVLQKKESGDAQLLVQNAIDSAKRATDVNPKDVANWSVRGFIYRNLIGLVLGAEDWSLQSYEKAIELEPKNPYLFTELGIAQALKKDFDSASDNFNKAIELKSDYEPAITYLKQVKQGSQPKPPIQTEKPPERLETK